jgi:hypothetical protein
MAYQRAYLVFGDIEGKLDVRASLKRSLTGESASSGVGSKHGSVVLLLREIVMGEQAAPCLVQFLSPSNEYALAALRREEINVCFFEFAI